jgi:hypothetical protein
VAGRRFVRRASSAKHGDLVWITTVIAASLLEATPTDIGLIVIPSDWGNQVGFDRATLMGIRGWLGWSQQAAATAADATGCYIAVYLTDASVAANSMDPGTATEYSDFDTIWTDGFSLSQTTGTAGPFPSRQLELKSKRKLTSTSAIKIAASVDGDTGTPRVNFNGVFRALLKLSK